MSTMGSDIPKRRPRRTFSEEFKRQAARLVQTSPLGTGALFTEGPNLHAYVTGEPVGRRDPAGLFVLPIGRPALSG